MHGCLRRPFPPQGGLKHWLITVKPDTRRSIRGIIIAMNPACNDLPASDYIRERVAGNTVGSWSTHFWKKYPQHCYAFGLWCADGYHRTSSIGLTSVNAQFIKRFREFLLGEFPVSRLRLRIYYPHGERPDEKAFREYSDIVVMYPMRKCKQIAMQLYVNSRPLLRMIQQSRREVWCMTDSNAIGAYFAGRFDGDGSIDSDNRKYCRIVYSNQREAEFDRELIAKIGISNASVYDYRAAGEWCLYVPRSDAGKFLKIINQFRTGSRNVYSNPVETERLQLQA